LLIAKDRAWTAAARATNSGGGLSSTPLNPAEQKKAYAVAMCAPVVRG
jgi:hypothetical protein